MIKLVKVVSCSVDSRGIGSVYVRRVCVMHHCTVHIHTLSTDVATDAITF